MYLDAQDSLKLGEYGYYEPEETALIKQLLKSDWTCLDIGSHIGYFTLLMAKQCDWVYSFEPDRRNYNILVKNIELNKLNNVMPSPLAITDHRFTQDMLYLSDSNSGMHRLYKSKWWDGDVNLVPTETIDAIFRRADFIKMDIEGAELGALKGMKNLLTNSKPTILMEFCPQYIEEYGADPQEEYQFLKALGYDIRLLPDKDTSISFADLEKETRKEPTGRNILCVV